MFLTPGARLGGGRGGRRGFPAGTTTLFYQAAAPLGWTKLTTQNDKALRVVSGSGGVSGGTNSFSSVMAQTVVGNTTLSTAQLSSHSHAPTTGGGNYIDITNINTGVQGFAAGTSFTAASYDNSTGLTGTGSAHNHTITMSIQYIDLILASKN